jgi:outer membrane immunogenic protein
MNKIALRFAIVAGLIATPALGADMALKAPPAAPAPACTWCGWYVGGNVGYGWGRDTDPGISFIDGGVNFTGFFNTGGNVYRSVDPRGAVGGLQLGYNWQTGNWVVGAIADFDGAGIKASGSATSTIPPTIATINEGLSGNVKWFGTVRAKVGYAAGKDWLLYGTGGLAYGRVSEVIGFNCPAGGIGCFVGTNFNGSQAMNKVGWTAGAGVDYMLSNRVSLGLEYLYLNLGTETVTGFSTTGAFPTSFLFANQHFGANIVRGTLDFHFTP